MSGLKTAGSTMLQLSTYERVVSIGCGRVSHVPDDVTLRHVLRRRCRQIAVGINETQALSRRHVLADHVLQKRGLTGAGLPDDVLVEEAVSAKNAEGSVRRAGVGGAEAY